jgi:hypothetical protein
MTTQITKELTNQILDNGNPFNNIVTTGNSQEVANMLNNNIKGLIEKLWGAEMANHLVTENNKINLKVGKLGINLSKFRFMLYLSFLATGDYKAPTFNKNVKYVNIAKLDTSVFGEEENLCKAIANLQETLISVYKLTEVDETTYTIINEQIKEFDNKLHAEDQELTFEKYIYEICRICFKVDNTCCFIVDSNSIRKNPEHQWSACKIVNMFPTTVGNITKELVQCFLEKLNKIAGVQNGKSLLNITTTEDGTVVIDWDNTCNYYLTDEGVYREHEYVQPMMICDDRYHNLVLCNSFASFLFTLYGVLDKLQSYNGNLYLGAFEKVLRRELAVDKDAQQGAETSGCRKVYLSQSSYAYKLKSYWDLDTIKNGLSNGIVEPLISIARLPEPWTIAKEALKQYNAFLSSKNQQFMAGNALSVRSKDIPVEVRLPLVIELMCEAAKTNDIAEAMKIVFKYSPVDNADLEKALKLIADKVIFTFSEKIAKITERIKLALSTAPQLLVKGYLTPFVSVVDMRNPIYKREMVLFHKVVLGDISNHPGIVARISEFNEEDGIFVKYCHLDTLELYDENQIEVMHLDADYIPVEKNGRKTYKWENNCAYVTNLTNNNENIILDTYTEEGVQKPLQGLQVTRGQEIFKVGYQVNGVQHQHVICADDDCILYTVTFKVKQFGNSKTLEYKLEGDRPVFVYKLRGILKAMQSPAITGSHYLYNSLNTNLPKGIDIVLSKDSQKHTDLCIRELPYIAATCAMNNHMDKIVELNTSLGYPEITEYLVINQLAALQGAYAELRKWFWARYGQTLWIFDRDDKNSTWEQIRKAYTLGMPNYNEPVEFKGQLWVRRTVKDLEDRKLVPVNKFPAKADVWTTCCRKNITVIDKYDTIYVWYNNNHKHCPLVFWQRVWSAASIVNEANVIEHVYSSSKAEITDFQDNTTTSTTMFAIPTNAKYPVGAGIQKNHTALTQNLVVPMALNNNVALKDEDGDTIESIKVFDNKGNQTEEFISLFKYYPKEVEEFLVDKNQKVILNVLSNNIFKIADLNMFVPSILAADSTGSTLECATSLTLSIIADLLRKCTYGEIVQRVNRLKAAINKGLGYENGAYGTGTSLQRGATGGIKGVLSKVLGLSGLPARNVYVYSENPKSTAQLYLRLALKGGWTRKEILGANLWADKETDPISLDYRAPLASQVYTRNVIVQPGQYLFDFQDEEKGCVNDLWTLMKDYAFNRFIPFVAMLINGGDCDGDGLNSVVIEKDIAKTIAKEDLASTEIYLKAIKLATSKEAYDPTSDSYLMDWYIPKPIALSTFENGKSISSKNIVLADGQLYKHATTGLVTYGDNRRSWHSIAESSCYNKGKYIGLAYKLKSFVAYIANITEALGLTVKDGMPNWSCNPNITKGLLKAFEELYEGGPLGGLSWDVYHMMEILEVVVEEGYDPRNVEDFSKIVEKAGLNANYAQQYLEVADALHNTVRFYKQQNSKPVRFEAVRKAETVATKVYGAALLMLQATQGLLDFSSKSELAATNWSIAVNYAINSDLWYSPKSKSVVLDWLNDSIVNIVLCQTVPDVDKRALLNTITIDSVGKQEPVSITINLSQYPIIPANTEIIVPSVCLETAVTTVELIDEEAETVQLDDNIVVDPTTVIIVTNELEEPSENIQLEDTTVVEATTVTVEMNPLEELSELELEIMQLTLELAKLEMEV